MDPIRFCSRCGHPSDEPAAPLARRRVCDVCGMGVVLDCPRDALPSGVRAFLICTHELIVSAVSESAEPLFGSEEAVVGASLLDLVTSPLGDDQVSRHVALAAERPSEPVSMPLRSVSAERRTMGMLAAWIVTCGPPRAALVSVQPSGFGLR